MIRTLLPTLHSATHRRPALGLTATVVLYAFGGMVQLVCGKSIGGGRNISAIQEWLNSDDLIQSGRCRRKLAPT
ncbi:hypothetical protein K9N68_03365 [Kovacikia minuta CCNUW1]|uniref:hypothetical protein n=1 Tax=Kovacikia minuta TaxID=2931930 RepID=UPI001CCEE6FF|nr:hypothetical protein [Kovacikia minuta]UBF27033.1 hypothetical protein K9N68_03365 [Kovacikia minuta CCNUW1]